MLLTFRAQAVMALAVTTWCLALPALGLDSDAAGQGLAPRVPDVDSGASVEAPDAADTSDMTDVVKKHKKLRGYKPLGCYEGYFLSDIHVINNTVTPKLCASYCSAYPYFSLEDGNACLCGSSVTSLNTTTGCSTPCVGDSKSICGGFGKKSIYHKAKPTGHKPPIAGNFTLIGCYSSGNLDGARFYNTSDSVQVCAKFCAGSKYMAVENGQQCSCGTATPDLTPKTDCGVACAANPNEYCGGFGSKNLYKSS